MLEGWSWQYYIKESRQIIILIVSVAYFSPLASLEQVYSLTLQPVSRCFSMKMSVKCGPLKNAGAVPLYAEWNRLTILSLQLGSFRTSVALWLWWELHGKFLGFLVLFCAQKYEDQTNMPTSISTRAFLTQLRYFCI